MSFEHQKKIFLAKSDKSSKGSIDQKVVPLLLQVNQKAKCYTTSSCSGRAVLWRGTGKKFENEWLNVSHDKIKSDFFDIKDKKGLIWFRFEPFILHVCCVDMDTAKELLVIAKRVYKKSCILSIGKKIIIEIRGSEIIEMPIFEDNQVLLSKDFGWLVKIVNKKFEKVWIDIEKFRKLL